MEHPATPAPESSNRELSLAGACAAGDHRACEALARWSLPQVRRTVALMYGSGAEADDIVQLVMIRVFSRLETFRGESSLYAWMHSITLNAVRDHSRRRKLVPVSEEVLEELSGGAQSQEQELDRSELMERLSTHFGALKPKLRMPLVLSVLHGYTVPEIAAMLDISFEAAKKRLLRGRQLLLQRLGKDPRCFAALKEMGR